MRRHVDLGHDVYAPLRRIGDDVLDLLLRIPAHDGDVVDLSVLPAVDLRLVALAADLGEQRILLDLNAPALIVGQMPMQHVELVQTHEVEDLFDLLFAEEVARLVDLEPSPLKARTVLDARARDGRLAALFELRERRHAQRLHAVDRAAPVRSGDLDAVLADRQLVALGGHRLVVLYDDGSFFAVAELFAEVALELGAYQALGAFERVRDGEILERGKLQPALFELALLRKGNYLVDVHVVTSPYFHCGKLSTLPSP